MVEPRGRRVGREKIWKEGGSKKNFRFSRAERAKKFLGVESLEGEGVKSAALFLTRAHFFKDFSKFLHFGKKLLPKFQIFIQIFRFLTFWPPIIVCRLKTFLDIF